MPRSATYPIELMRAAKAALLKPNCSLRELSRRLQIPRSTLRGWAAQLAREAPKYLPPTIATIGTEASEAPPLVDRDRAGDRACDDCADDQFEAPPARGRDKVEQYARFAPLDVPLNATPRGWASWGRAHPLPGFFNAAQAGRIFELAAMGVPFADAIDAAGGKGGDVEILQSNWKAGEQPSACWFEALKIAQGAFVARAAHRVFEGLMGWQGAAKMLAVLRPATWGDRLDIQTNQANSAEGLDDAVLCDIVRRQLARAEGRPITSPVSEEVMPLSETGMEEKQD